MAKSPVMDVNALAPERDTVRITSPLHPDGKVYEIVSMDPVEGDLGAQERVELGALAKRSDELKTERILDESGQVDAKVLAEFERVINEFMALVFRGIEPEVIDALRLGQKESLLGAFIEASPEMQAAIEAEAQRMKGQAKSKKKTPARSSRGSKGSTGGTRKRGSGSGRRS